MRRKRLGRFQNTLEDLKCRILEWNLLYLGSVIISNFSEILRPEIVFYSFL